MLCAINVIVNLKQLTILQFMCKLTGQMTDSKKL